MSNNNNTATALLGQVWAGDLTPAQGAASLARHVRAEEGRAKEAARAQARAAVKAALAAGEQAAKASLRLAGEALQAEVADGNLPREEARRLFRRARDLARIKAIPVAPKQQEAEARASAQAQRAAAQEVQVQRVLEAETPEDQADLLDERCLEGRMPYKASALDEQILADRAARQAAEYAAWQDRTEKRWEVRPRGTFTNPPVRRERTLEANSLLRALGVLRPAGLGFPGVEVRLIPYKHAYKVTFQLRGWKAEILFGVLGDAWPKASLYLNETNVFVSLPGPQVDEALDKLAYGKARAQHAQDQRLRRWRAEENSKEAVLALSRILEREEQLGEEGEAPTFQRKAEADRKWDDYDRRVLNPLFVATQEVHRLETMASWDAYDNVL